MSNTQEGLYHSHVNGDVLVPFGELIDSYEATLVTDWQIQIETFRNTNGVEAHKVVVRHGDFGDIIYFTGVDFLLSPILESLYKIKFSLNDLDNFFDDALKRRKSNARNGG